MAFGCAVFAPVEVSASAGVLLLIWRWGRDSDPRTMFWASSAGCKPDAFSRSATPPQRTQRASSSGLSSGCWPFVCITIQV